MDNVARLGFQFFLSYTLVLGSQPLGEIRVLFVLEEDKKNEFNKRIQIYHFMLFGRNEWSFQFLKKERKKRVEFFGMVFLVSSFCE